MKFRLLIAGLLSAGAVLAAPPYPTITSSTPLSLDSLISLGYENNPALRQTVLDTRLNVIGKVNAIGNFLPEVSVGMSFSQNHFKTETYLQSDGRVATYPIPAQQYTDYSVVWMDTALDGSLSNPKLVQNTYTSEAVPIPSGDSRSSQMYLSLNESLFEGGRRYFLYRMAKVQEKINNLSVVDARKSIGRRVAQQVVIVLTNEKLVALDKKLRDQRQDAYDLAKARFDVGAVTELDVLQSQIELGNAENSVTSAERDLQAQREALNQLLGIDLKSSFPLVEAQDISPAKYEIDNLVTEALGNRTDLQIADLAVKRAKHNLNMTYSNYLPTASLGMQWSASEQSGKDESFTLNPRNRNSSASLSLRWNLFDGFTREYNVQTLRVAEAKAEEQRRSLRLELEKSVRDAYYNLEKVFNQLQITGRNRELADRTLSLERERYRLGATSALGLRDAQVTYAQAETEHLQKTLEYQSSLIALELAVGKSLR
jgi:outer membrane protein